MKVQRFCLTLLGDARLWYQFIRTYNWRLARVDKIYLGYNTPKLVTLENNLFHAWRSFAFDENTETIDVYVTCISQVAVLLVYGEPQILEVFQEHTPHKIILNSVSYRRT